MLDIVIAVLALGAGDPAAAVSPPWVAVSGACTCPAPTDVAAQLAVLARPSTAGPPPPVRQPPERHDAVLTCSADGTVDVVLRHANGQRIGDRALAAQGSCADLAAAIAVIIGAWEADLDPGVSASVALPAPVVVELSRPQGQQPPPAAPGVAPPAPLASPAGTPPPAAPAPPSRGEPAPSPEAMVVEHSERRNLAARAGSRPDVSGALGILGATDGSAIVPGATLEGDVFRAGSRLGLAAALTGTLPRETSVGTLSSVARWYRLTMNLGPAFRFNAGSTRMDLQAGVVAGLLHIAGNGLPNASSDSGLQWGATVGVRATRSVGPTAIWAGVGLLVFPGDDRLVVSDVPTEGHLPHFELQVASGFRFGRRR